MLHFIARALTRVPLLALGGFATIAAAAPVSINSEQKAAGAVLTANNFAHNALGHHWALLERTVFFANRARLPVRAALTPDSTSSGVATGFS